VSHRSDSVFRSSKRQGGAGLHADILLHINELCVVSPLRWHVGLPRYRGCSIGGRHGREHTRRCEQDDDNIARFEGGNAARESQESRSRSTHARRARHPGLSHSARAISLLPLPTRCRSGRPAADLSPYSGFGQLRRVRYGSVGLFIDSVKGPLSGRRTSAPGSGAYGRTKRQPADCSAGLKNTPGSDLLSHAVPPRSTIGGRELNFRVRNGNGCDPSPMTTGKHRLRIGDCSVPTEHRPLQSAFANRQSAT
jgi:hypothetical protein